MFGPPPQNHATSSLPQHGFARNSNWEFLGKSSSEAPGSDAGQADLTVKLDFGLSHSMLTEEFRKAWPYEFGLVYSVTLTQDTLETSLQVRNEGAQNFEFQVLMHTYLNIAVRYEDNPSFLIYADMYFICRISPIFVSRASSPRHMSTRPSRRLPTLKHPQNFPSPRKPIVFTRTSVIVQLMLPPRKITDLSFRSLERL